MAILDLFRLDGRTALVTGCRRGKRVGFSRRERECDHARIHCHRPHAATA